MNDASQELRFVPADPQRGEAIVAVGFNGWPGIDVVVGGVRFVGR